MNWHYRVKAPDEKVRDPIQGKFFSTEAIKNPADRGMPLANLCEGVDP